MKEILTLEKVSTYFPGRSGTVRAVCDADLTVMEGHITGLVGETGCGKSVLGQTILRLTPPTAVMQGKIIFEGRDLMQMTDEEIRAVRGRKIAYINQNPAEALDPVMRIGRQMTEAVRACGSETEKEAEEKSEDILSKLSFEDPKAIMRSYPGELSGGMKQRVMVGMAMCGDPDCLIADEPTKGLDSMIRGQVIETMKKFIEMTRCSGLIITHDLRFARAICDDIALMYAGELVEHGPAKELLTSPAHPYLKALLASMPQNGMHTLRGSSCSLIDLPEGCRFAARCPGCTERCTREHPDMEKTGKDHEVRCFEI